MMFKVKFRSFDLEVHYNSKYFYFADWRGPKHWKAAIDSGCKLYFANDGFAGLDLVEYLDALDIGRNVPKSVQGKKKI